MYEKYVSKYIYSLYMCMHAVYAYTTCMHIYICCIYTHTVFRYILYQYSIYSYIFFLLHILFLWKCTESWCQYQSSTLYFFFVLLLGLCGTDKWCGLDDPSWKRSFQPEGWQINPSCLLMCSCPRRLTPSCSSLRPAVGQHGVVPGKASRVRTSLSTRVDDLF